MPREYSPHEERLRADRRIEPEVRFVQCRYCEGEGEVQTGTATIYEPGCGFWHDDAVMSACPECNGTGRAETPVYPVECDEVPFAPVLKQG